MSFVAYILGGRVNHPTAAFHWEATEFGLAAQRVFVLIDARATVAVEYEMQVARVVNV